MSKKLVVFLALVGLVGTSCGASDTATTDAAAPAVVADASPDTADGGDGAADADDPAGAADGDEASAVGADRTSPALAQPVSYAPGTLGAMFQAEVADPASARFEGEVVITGAPGSGAESLTIGFDGGFDHAAQAMEMSVDMSGLADLAASSGDLPPQYRDAFTEPARVKVVGGEAWMQWGLLGMLTGTPESWMALSADDVGSVTGLPTGSGMPTQPTGFLEGFLGADTTGTEDLGTETIRGVETRHWRVQVDVDALAEAADPVDGTEARAELEAAGVGIVPVDLWVGVDTGYVHRFATTVTSDGVVAGAATASVWFEMFDVGSVVEVTPPPADQVVAAPPLAGF